MSHSSEELLAALLGNDGRGARRIAKAALDARAGVAALYEEVITPALVEIGVRWQEGELTVADEHAATALVEEMIASLHPSYDWPASRPGVRAIVTAVAGEYHCVGARMLADLLSLDGWEVSFLGASTPIDALVARAASQDARLVAISVSMGWHVPTARAAVAALRAGAPRAEVIVGGRALACYAAPASVLAADDYASSARAAVDVVRRLSCTPGTR